MRSLTKALVVGWIGAVIVAGLWAAQEAPSTFEAVCARLRAVKQVEADFNEVKTLKILSRPLESRGTLLFSPQKGVYRVTLEPFHQEMLITHSQLIQKDAQGNIQKMAVRGRPEARAFVDVFLSFFAGDSRAWEKSFEASFSGALDAWQIEFAPHRKSPAAKALRRITLKGHQGVLDAMILEEANGDLTHTSYDHQKLSLNTDPGDPATPFPLTLNTP